MFFTVSVLICVFSLVQTSFISEKTLSVAALVPGRLRQNSTSLKATIRLNCVYGQNSQDSTISVRNNAAVC